MTFLSKEELHKYADEFGIDLTGLPYGTQQKLVFEALKAEKNEAKSKEDNVETVATKVKKQATEPEYNPMKDMAGKTMVLSPELATTQYQFYGFEEDLGEEELFEEVSFDIRQVMDINHSDAMNATYRSLGTTGKRVIATTGLPKESAGITFRPDRDLVPIAIRNGRAGYLWTHHRLPSIKNLLIECGEYENYKNKFKDDPAVWHCNGLLVCDINLVHSVFAEIERKHSKRD